MNTIGVPSTHFHCGCNQDGKDRDDGVVDYDSFLCHTYS